jgi:steroid 5-alpha reductase family enzyme
MSYVDIGWPLGLTVIGGLTWWHSDGDPLRIAMVSIAYIFAGSCMSLGALIFWIQGRLKKEFPCYEYQKQHWTEAGKKNTKLAMQVNALWQGLANASFLAMPAFVIAANPSGRGPTVGGQICDICLSVTRSKFLIIFRKFQN